VSHLDLDRLADLLAGEGTGADVAHVGDCADCAGRLDELAAAEVEVAAALAALPAPVPPPGLADRLAAALAAEPPLEAPLPSPVALPSPAERGDPAAGTRTVTPFPAARRERSRAPFAAAAALLVAAGALGGTLLLSGRDGAQDTIAAGEAGGSALAEDALGVPTSSTGADYAADPSLLAAALPDLLRGSAAARAGDAGAEAVPAPPVTAMSESADAQAGGGTTAGSVPADDPLARLRDPAELAGCLSQLLPPGEDVLPLALDYAAYRGQPALVVVLPGSGEPAKVDVFVVGAQCRPGDDRTLFFTRLDRPA
jgi:hypothetical protein